jgi:hypothetical protein
MYIYMYMSVKLGLSHWEKNIEWECYWNNFMYIYMYMGVKLGLSHWEKNIEWGFVNEVLRKRYGNEMEEGNWWMDSIPKAEAQ